MNATGHTTPTATRRSMLLAGALLALVALSLSASAAAHAAVRWRVVSVADTTVAPGAHLTYHVEFFNVGDENTDFVTPINLTLRLPKGMIGLSADTTPFTENGQSFECPGAAGATVIKCTGSPPPFLPSHGEKQLSITAAVDPGTTESSVLTAAFELEGGGAPEIARTVDPVTVSSAPPAFGVAAFDGAATKRGVPLTQAGGHPDTVTTSIDFDTFTDPSPVIGDAFPVQDTRDVTVELPPGFVANPTGLSQCTPGQLASGGLSPAPLCPADSQIGVALVRHSLGTLGPVPVFNMVPPPGVPARFAFNVNGSIVVLDGHVRSGGDYGLGVTASDVPQGLAIAGNTLTLWGVPSDPSHDSERSCPGQNSPSIGGATCPGGTPRKAFFRNPTSCTAPGVGLTTTVSIDSWQNPGVPKSASFTSHELPGYPFAPQDWGQVVGITGCESVPFTPSLEAQPLAGSKANAPSGFAFNITVPQDESPDTPASQSDVKKITIALPQGVRVSPSSASGLGACTSAQIALKSTGMPSCPDSSKLGTVTIKSPLLDVPVEGNLFLATPHDNPFNSLIAVYLVASAKGVVLKLPGEGKLDPVTGQITTTFDNMPQLPFESAHVELRGGPRAPLAMPDRCGTFTTHAQLTGWSGKTVTQDSSFTLTEDAQGQPCPSVFSPNLNAGTTNPVAGGYSPFSLRLTRTDGDGEFSSLSSLSLPKGLLANVASIATRCTIDQADAHACPADSHVGEVMTGAGAGAGPNPFYVGGDVYLTGPYKGNPFGIAVVVHAEAGPFDLGYVVVKGAIQIHDDGSVMVATDPFPTILQGIPLQIRDVRVNLDRPGFMFNPTSCNPMSISGTVVSTAGQQVGVSSRFQVGECANLAFKPSFTVSTVGKTSKASGASLHVHLATHEGPGNTGAGATRESDIAKVDVQLPVVLPARLPTLQKACTAAQFAANPAGCPEGSFVGTAVAHTPILSSPLSGPAILVSHGGEAFPDLVLVLQGEGVRLNLTGHTQIKKGITFSHFETVPDAPVSSFDLTLPQGPHGVLTTDIPGRNLCATTRTVTVTKRVTRRINGHTRRVTVKAKKAVAAPLSMPTTMTAQNGAVIHQTTKIAVTGCAAVKAKAKKKGAKKSRR